MKKLFISLLITLASASAFAGSLEPVKIANMKAQCNEVMGLGVCRVVLDPKDYTNPTILIAGVGRISTYEYLRVRAAGLDKDEQGRFKMCELIETVCTEDADGDACKAVRALWRQN